MTENFVGPYVLKLEYTCNATPGGVVTHHASYNVVLPSDPAIGAPFNTINVTKGDGNPVLLSTWCATWLGLIDFQFNNTLCTFAEWQLYKAQAGSNNLDYRSAETISHSWTNTNTITASLQTILSFRSAGGGLLYLHFMETTGTRDVPKVYSQLSANFKALVDHVLDPTANVIYARNNFHPSSFIRIGASINNKLEDLRYRP